MQLCSQLNTTEADQKPYRLFSQSHDVVVVILSEAKDLKVYVTVDGRTDCEILRYAQDDIAYNSSRHCEELQNSLQF